MTVTRARLAAYGLLGLPLAMAALPVYVHVPKFYGDALGVPLAVVGAILLASRALDALQDPLIGWWSDRARGGAAGRWTFVLAGTPLLAIGMAALFVPPRWSGVALAAWLAMALVVVHLAYSLVTIAYQAHGAEAARDPAQRTRIVAWREGFALAGVLAAAVLPEALRDGAGDRGGFALFALVFAPLAITAAIVAWRGSPPSLSHAAAGLPVAEALLRPWRNARFRALVAVFVLNGVAAAIPATLVLFFVEDVLEARAIGPVALAAYFAAGAIGLPLWVRLAARWGRSPAWLCAMVLSVAAFAGAFRLGPGDAGAFLAICVASGLALGADLALPPAMLAEAIDGDEARGEGRHEGAYFGLWNLVAKLNLALAAGLSLPLLHALGFRPGSGSGAAALATVYALVPCVLKLAAALALLRFHRLHGDPT